MHMPWDRPGRTWRPEEFAGLCGGQKKIRGRHGPDSKGLGPTCSEEDGIPSAHMARNKMQPLLDVWGEERITTHGDNNGRT